MNIKGAFGGWCNVSRCLLPGATWFNQSTRAHYCSRCAAEINRFNPDSVELYGGPLCIQVSDGGVIRYVITHLTVDNVASARQLAGPMQGHRTHATFSDAKHAIKAIMENNSESTLRSVYNLPLEVRPVECYPGHFDPKTCWFD